MFLIRFLVKLAKLIFFYDLIIEYFFKKSLLKIPNDTIAQQRASRDKACLVLAGALLASQQ